MITKILFNSLFPTKGLNPRKFNLVRRRDELIAAMNEILPKYGIDNYFRICAFLGNCGIETDYFRTTSEYASGWAYDISINPQKARGLGNLTKGDGPKYKGSGLSQTTGKNNFKAVQRAIGKLLGIDVVQSPEILRNNIRVAVESACIFWRDNNLNAYADCGEFKKLSAIVNRGDEDKMPLHWEKRNALYKILLVSVPKNFGFDVSAIASNVVENQATVVLTPTENNSPEALAVPPVSIEPKKDDSFLSEAFDRSKVKELGEKVLKHCPKDSVKNIFLVITARIWAAIIGMWAFGIFGKIFLVVICLVIVGSFVYALVYYRKRFLEWSKRLLDAIFEAIL